MTIQPTLIQLQQTAGLKGPARITRFDTPQNGIVGIVHDIVAMQAGVTALGHDFQTDSKTLELMQVLGNQTKEYQGGVVWGRLGHPGMSENATAKKILEARNFRIAGNELIYDAHLLESSRLSPAFSNTNPPYEWLFYIAENNPKEVASSVVVYAYTVWTTPDGAELTAGENERPENALTDLPVLRPVVFDYVDIVNEGALTYNGMFERAFKGTSSAYLAELFPALDQFREQFQIPLKELPIIAGDVMAKYMMSRGYKPENEGENMTIKGKGIKFAPRNKGGLPLKPIQLDNGGATDESAGGAVAQETPPDETEDETDPLDDILETAESAVADEESDETTDENEGAESEFAKYEERIAGLESMVAYLSAQNEKLVEFARLTNKRIENLQRDIVALDEPTVSARVSKTPRPALASAGTIPPAILNQKPIPVSSKVKHAAIGENGAITFDELLQLSPEQQTLAIDSGLVKVR